MHNHFAETNGNQKPRQLHDKNDLFEKNLARMSTFTCFTVL